MFSRVLTQFRHSLASTLTLCALVCLFVSCTNKISIGFESATRTVYNHEGHVTVLVPLSRPSYRGLPIPFVPNPGEKFEVSVPIGISGTAINPTHHNLSSFVLPIDGGAAGNKIEFDVVRYSIDADADPEGFTLVLTMGQPEGAELGEISTETITILPEPPEPFINVASVSQTITEGQSTSLQVDLRNDYYEDVIIGYTVTGTSSSGTDHDVASGVLVVPAGFGQGTIPIETIQDGVYESNETIIITLTSFSNCRPGTNLIHTVTIQDDESPPVVTFDAASSNAYEDDGTVSIGLTLSVAQSTNLLIPYTVTGTANGVDHDLANGTLTITSNTTTGAFSVLLNNDGVSEGFETVIITLGNPPGASLGTPSVHSLGIYDPPPDPVLDFSAASQSLGEAGSTATVTLNAGSIPVRDIDVAYTVTGTAGSSDHNLTSGVFTITAGDTSTSVTITLTDDSIDEPDETIILTLGTPTHAALGTTTVHTITLVDDDPTPTVQWTAATQSLSESAGSGSITAQLSAASGRTIIVPYTVAGSASIGVDHDFNNGSITINPGSSTGAANFSISSDTTDEPDETIVVTIGGPTNATVGATNIQTITLTDDDPPPGLQFNASNHTVSEAVGVATVPFNITAASSYDIDVSYSVAGTATKPADHNLSSGVATVYAGNTTGTITLTVYDDAVTEGTETVLITLNTTPYATLGSPILHTIFITDNDRKPNAAPPALDPKEIPELSGWFTAESARLNSSIDTLQEWKNELENHAAWTLPDPGATLGKAYRTDFLEFLHLPEWETLPEAPLSYGWVEIGDEWPLSLTVYEDGGLNDCSIAALVDQSDSTRRLLEVFSLTSPELPLKVWDYLSFKFGFQKENCQKREPSP